MDRTIQPPVIADLARKMVFVGGPRQVGKTTLALNILGGDERHPAYLDWDNVENKQQISAGHLPANQPLIVFDELHKYREWRNLLKGLYDKRKGITSFLVTGSARLDLYRKGGDSLQGRYLYYRLHPFSLYELNRHPSKEDLLNLLRFGGFPEPFLVGSEREWRRWQQGYRSRITREELIDLRAVREVSQLELLVSMLRERAGSLLSVNALREDLKVSHETASRWLLILEDLYYCFCIHPWMGNLTRSLKKERKLYLWDWSAVTAEGAGFENLVASNLLKYCHFLEDTEGLPMQLRFLRDRQGHELDFVVMEGETPRFAVECKRKPQDPIRSFSYFLKRTEIPLFYQVHMEEDDYELPDRRIRVIPFIRFCAEVLRI
uniref:AAA+ ATPase domain-containing protein n=1 Tax=Candidatus Kentrum sp. FW TaxID=2126338 RepID=A0A450U0C2_9GAMM|nr:MAG: hypothetical protein BECKFW1821C_GA0114237_10843 [Candidatus Kentron sp. FW]